jgi:cytochrome-b5 reductase
LVEKNEKKQFGLKIIKKEQIAHDTYAFTLEFPNPEWIAGMWPAAVFKFVADIDGKEEGRPYTPVSPVNQKGSADFIMKVYRSNPEFPNGGKFSQFFEKNLNVGDEMKL